MSGFVVHAVVISVGLRAGEFRAVGINHQRSGNTDDAVADGIDRAKLQCSLEYAVTALRLRSRVIAGASDDLDPLRQGSPVFVALLSRMVRCNGR